MDRGAASLPRDRVTDAELSAALLAVAIDLDGAGVFPHPGIIRVAARRLAERARDVPPAQVPDRCRSCDAPLIQPATGRRRIFCTRPACQDARRHGGKTRQNAMVAS